ncbi:MAG: hypothetical protein WB676_02220 [Bryobacteraceae bacterium]
MPGGDLETDIESFVDASGANPDLYALIENNAIRLLKYLSAERLEDTLKQQHLYAAERAGFTWGDAIYLTPARYPRATMMYGEVGVVGSWSAKHKRFFNAADPLGIDLYQRWIVTQRPSYLRLTTTVHANEANRTLRNDFRTRFQIDCVYFRPDETCLDYVDEIHDWWFAITHWDTSRSVGHGYSKEVTNLRWCVISPESFKSVGLGYKAFLYKTLTSSHKCMPGHYSSLKADIEAAYEIGDTVVVCDFD